MSSRRLNRVLEEVLEPKGRTFPLAPTPREFLRDLQRKGYTVVPAHFTPDTRVDVRSATGEELSGTINFLLLQTNDGNRTFSASDIAEIYLNTWDSE